MAPPGTLLERIAQQRDEYGLTVVEFARIAYRAVLTGSVADGISPSVVDNKVAAGLAFGEGNSGGKMSGIVDQNGVKTEYDEAHIVEFARAPLC